MRVRELLLQNVIDHCAQVFRCWHSILKLLTHIQIFQVEFGYNLALDAFVEIDQVADHAISVNLSADSHLQHIIVSVAVRIVALAVGSPVFRLRHVVAVQPVRSRESVSSR